MKVTLNTLTPELFLELYTSVGWEPPGKEQVETALKNTLAGFTAFDEDKPLRMGRSRNVQNDTLIITHKNRNALLWRITVLLSSIQKKSHIIKCLLNIGNNVINIFKTNGQSDKSAVDSCCRKLLVCKLTVCCRCRVKNAGAYICNVYLV